MEADFWHERWDSGQVAFDQAEPNPLLTAHWSVLGLPAGSVVFVPLAGRSIDMVWLADQGHRVIGNELSARAITEFVAANELRAESRRAGSLTVHTAHPYELWCGDFFAMDASALTEVSAVYDRASLVALPPDMRRRYADHLAAIVPPSASTLLISFEYDQTEMDGPPFSVSGDEIAALYGARFDIELVANEDVMARSANLRERGLTGLHETVHVLRPRH